MAYTIAAPPRPNIGGPGQVQPPRPFNPIAPPKARGPVVPPQFSNFAKNGGWSVLSKPGVAQGYAQALMNTAQHPHGTTPPRPVPHGDPNIGNTMQRFPTPPGGLGAIAAGIAGTTPAAPAPQASPFDATYYANINANQFKANNDINNLNLQGAQNDTALAQALAQLNYQQPRDSLKAEQSFNNRGGLYSSVENQALGDLTHSYAQKQSAAQTSHDTTSGKLAAQIAAINAGIPIYNSQQEAASASRLAAAAAKDPTLGEGTGGLDTQPGRVTGGTQIGINRAGNNPNQPHPKAPAKPKAPTTRITTGRLGSVVSARPTIKPGSKPKANPKTNALAKALGQKSRPTVLRPQPKKGKGY